MNMLASLISASLVAATLPAEAISDPGLDKLLAERLANVTSLFEAKGGSCAISQPKLVLDVVPSFGIYDDTDNTLHITT
jgi:hypothetical protein